MEPSWDSVFAHAKDVVARRIAGELLLVPIRKHVKDLDRLFALNEVAAEIYAHMDGTRTLVQIRDLLLEEYEVDRAGLEADLLRTVAQLLDVKAIAPVEAGSTKHA